MRGQIDAARGTWLLAVDGEIADLPGAAFLAVSNGSESTSRWYQVNLSTGKAEQIGTIGGGEIVVGMAIEP